MSEDRQILLISDDQEKASVLRESLNEYLPKVELKIVEKFQQSEIVLGRQLPALIILLVTVPANSHMEWLKKTRLARKFNEVPVFVYTELPGKNEMQELLRSLQN